MESGIHPRLNKFRRGILTQETMKTSKLIWQASFLILPLIGGILMGLTPSPVEAWPLAWIALVPLWFFVATGKSLRQSVLCGLVWGMGYHGLAIFWITGIHPMTWMGVPWLASFAIALFCWTFLTLWGATLVAIWAACQFWLVNSLLTLKVGRLNVEGSKENLQSTTLKGRVGFWMNHKSKILAVVRVLIGTALWCGLEALWSAGPLWWTSLSYTQSPHNLAILHLGQLSGPSTVTAAIVAVNAWIGEAWISYQNGKGAKGWKVGRLEHNLQPTTSLQPVTLVAIATGLLLVLHLIGFGLYSRPLIQPSVAALKVGIIQGNIPNEIKLYSEGGRRAIEGYTEGYRTLADRGVDAVLTPEGALPFQWNALVRDRNSFYSAVLEKGVVAWIGAFGDRGFSYTNSLFTVTGNGETFSRYDKVKLVPLGEYIPFEEALGALVDRLSPLDAHQVAGTPNQLFETPFGRAIAGICYESAFSKYFQRQAAAGGQFILSSSNNAHYSASMPAQHHAQDVMRAIETDRWAVRATNTGYSAIVDPHGRTLWQSGINTYELHDHTIYRRQTQTLYVRWGDWLTPVLLGCAGLSWLAFKGLPQSH